MTGRCARTLASVCALLFSAGCASSGARQPDYSEYVWPPPPDKPRIELADIVWGRADVLAKTGGLQRALLGSAPRGPLDWFRRPFAVEFDAQGRLLVTDAALGALFRLDRAARRVDVFGTTGAMTLKSPLGMCVGPGGVVYVADVGIKKVVAFGADGKLVAVYGKEGELQNPTDAAVSPDGRRLFVTDSKAQQVVVFDRAGGQRLSAFGRLGSGDGEFSFPSALAFDKQGRLLVIDQINARVQIFDAGGGYLGQFGGLGTAFASFVRPKDVAVGEQGLIYVSDAAFANVQIFDPDRRLLTFVGANGKNPGQFQIASGVAAHGDRFAVVDQLGFRVQVFRFIEPVLLGVEAAAASTAPSPTEPPPPSPTQPAPPSPPQPVASTTPPPVPSSTPQPAPAALPVTTPSPAPPTLPSQHERPSPEAPRSEPQQAQEARAAAQSLLLQGRYAEAARGFSSSLKQSPGGFSVQIMVACSTETVARAVANVGAKELVILPVAYQGRDCHRMAWGAYATAAEAAAGLRDLPGYFSANGARPKVVRIVEMLR